MASKKKLALHWKILIGLFAGVVVGLSINALWTQETWASMGVRDVEGYLSGRSSSVYLPQDPELVDAIRARLDALHTQDAQSLVRSPKVNESVGTASAADVIQQLRALAASPPPDAEEVRDSARRIVERLRAVPDGTPVEFESPEPAPHDHAKDVDAKANAWIERAVEAIRAKHDVLPRDPNADAGVVAWLARFVRQGNAFVGDLFMKGLRFIAVPIVLFSLIVGISSLKDMSKLGRIGGKTIGIYLLTTAVAITLGLILANLLGPGRGFDEGLRELLAGEQASKAAASISNAETRPDVWSVLLNIVPSNPFQSLAETEMLQVVFAAVVIGLGLAVMPREKAKPVIDFFDTMTEVIIKVVHGVLAIAPVAVFALIAQVLADLGIDVLVSLIKYVITTVLGLGLMIFLVYPMVLRLFTPMGYGRFFKAISPAQLLAFSSSSSGATLPVTMDCCEERMGASEEITSFVVPIGATINMDGTALYQGVAAVFIAQMYGMDLTIFQQAEIVLTATLASIGTAAVPGVGIVMLVIVLQSVGLPLDGIAVILGVDRILDMCRTTCNVTGDCMVCAVVASTEDALATPEELEARAG